jgi:hypothetical protein
VSPGPSPASRSACFCQHCALCFCRLRLHLCCVGLLARSQFVVAVIIIITYFAWLKIDYAADVVAGLSDFLVSVVGQAFLTRWIMSVGGLAQTPSSLVVTIISCIVSFVPEGLPMYGVFAASCMSLSSLVLNESVASGLQVRHDHVGAHCPPPCRPPPHHGHPPRNGTCCTQRVVPLSICLSCRLKLLVRSA